MTKSISEIIREISGSSDWDGDYRVGWPCDGFAWEVIEQFGAGEEYWVNEQHCYVKYNGRLYDEAHPEGILLENMTTPEEQQRAFAEWVEYQEQWPAPPFSEEDMEECIRGLDEETKAEMREIYYKNKKGKN